MAAESDERAPRASFFDEQYLASYGQSHDDAGSCAEALAAAQAVGAVPSERVLDVPCGYGRHAVPLAAAGYVVVGLDSSRPLLDEAARRAGEAGGLELVHGDYRALPFADSSFAAVLCLDNSIGYLDATAEPDDAADMAVLAELRRVLLPGRRLLLQTAHRDRLVQTFRPRSWSRLSDGSLLLEEASFDPLAGVVAATQTRIDGTRSSSRSYRMRCYTLGELVGLLRSAGFAAVTIAGELDGRPFETTSRYAVLLATA